MLRSTSQIFNALITYEGESPSKSNNMLTFTFDSFKGYPANLHIRKRRMRRHEELPKGCKKKEEDYAGTAIGVGRCLTTKY